MSPLISFSRNRRSNQVYIYMNPFQCKVLSTAQFTECDLTYNESIECPYLFNVLAFNDDTMDVARVHLDKEGAKGYGLAYRKMLEKCSTDYPEFEVGMALLQIGVMQKLLD